MNCDIMRRAKFVIGKPMLIDPCIDCIIKPMCDSNKNCCIEKIKFDNAQPEKSKPQKTNLKKLKQSNVWRNLNAVRN